MTPRLLHYSNIRVKWRYNNISKEVESSLIKINRHPFYVFCLLNYISWLCCLYFCLLDVCIGLVLIVRVWAAAWQRTHVHRPWR